MANTNADVLRVTTTAALMPTTIREKQVGFATDSYELWFKAPGGANYQYAAQDGPTHYTDIYTTQYIYHEGDADTYIQFQDDQVDVYCGSQDMLRMVQGASDYFLVGPSSYSVFLGVGTLTPTRSIDVVGRFAGTDAVQQVSRFSALSTGTAIAGFGCSLELGMDDGTATDTILTGAYLGAYWATIGTDSGLLFAGMKTGVLKEWMYVTNNILQLGDGTQAIDYELRFASGTNPGSITHEDSVDNFIFSGSIELLGNTELFLGAATEYVKGDSGVVTIAGAVAVDLESILVSMKSDLIYLGTNGGDVAILFDGLADDGTITYKDDEGHFLIDQNLVISSGTPLIEFSSAGSGLSVGSGNAGYMRIDSSYGLEVRGPYLVVNQDAGAGVDPRILMMGETNNGIIDFKEDEDRFEFASDIRLTGDATVYEDANIDLSTLTTGGTTPGHATIASTNIRLRSFAVGEELDGSLEIPHSYKVGGEMRFHLHYLPTTAPTGTDYVRFEVEYFIVNADGTVSTATTINTGDVAVDTQWKRYDADFGVAVFTNASFGGQIAFKVKRIAAGGDAFAGEAAVLTFGVHYEVDSLGSDAITSKT